MEPRVALTVEQLWQPVPGGSGSYIRELVAALPAAGVAPIGVAARHGGDPVDGPIPVPVRASRLSRRVLYEAWSRLRSPRAEAIAGGADVVHATTWAVPGRRVPLVVTVHDLAFLRESAHFTPRGNRYFRRALTVVRHEAACIVVPSAATRDDCVAAGIDPGRVVVVPHGVHARDIPAEERTAWRRRLGLDRPYILWCGALEPRKNVPALVEAFRRVAREPGPSVDLVLAGPAGWGGTADQVRAALSGLPEGRVHWLGRLDAEQLQTAYAEAAAFAFPSLWEGFGMPVLEAMAHGVPVVTSRGTSMAEFVGGAGVLVDPRDIDELAGGLMAALGRDGRTDVTAMARAGRATAAAMTWQESARAHAEAYRRAAETR